MVNVPSTSQVVERRLATILSADVAEYSRLMAENEEQTVRTFRGHKAIFESIIETHRGRVFNTAGDAILAEFASAVEAVRCATEVQAALRTRNDQLTPSRQLRFRIGVNLGDVMLEGSDLLGDGVNIAARIQSGAEPGGVCISGSVYDQIRNKLSLSFRSMGEKNYKNIPQPVRTYSILGSDDFGPLPSNRAARSTLRHAKRIAPALFLTLLGAGYWFYTAYRDRETLRAAEGYYGGQVCMGPYREEQARCYTAHGIRVKGGNIAAEYPARDPSLRNVISGSVSGSGDVKMEIDIENGSGRLLGAAHLVGRFAGGTLLAAGDGFRSYNIDWRRE